MSAAGEKDGSASMVARRRPIRIAIVDDHPVVRDGLSALLDQEPGIEVVALAASVEDATTVLAREDVDVVVLDVRLGTASGLTALRTEAARSRPSVIVLTAYAQPQYARAAADLGASGFVLKSAPVSELVRAIEAAAAGDTFFEVDPSAPPPMGPRALEVVRLVADGRSNDEIGVAMGIAASTVETHLRRLYERFGVASRTELATRAMREGWLGVPTDPGSA